MTRDDPQPRADRAARPRATTTTTDATPPSLRNELESVYRSITDGVFIFDGEGRLIRMNDAGRKLLRLASDDESYLAMPALTRIERSNLRDPSGAPMLEREWVITRLLGGEIITPEHAVDVLMSRSDGADALIAFTGAPLRDGAGAITGAVAVGRDVTGRRLRGPSCASRTSSSPRRPRRSHSRQAPWSSGTSAWTSSWAWPTTR
jgi:PAS domain-containing protein